MRENFRPDKRQHEPLKRHFPFVTVRLYKAAKFFIRSQMRNFMHQCNEESVVVQVGIDGDFVFAIQGFSVISVACLPFVYNFEVD